MLNFRLGCRKRLQFEDAERTSIAPKKAQDNRTLFEETRKVDKTTALAAQPEPGRDLAGLHRLGGKSRFGESPDGAMHRNDHLWRGIRFVLATARVKLRLQGHPAAPRRAMQTRDASLIPIHLRHPYGSNKGYSLSE